MKPLKAADLIQYARKHSPFYRELYSSLPKEAALEDVPVLAQDAFWKANGLSRNQVLSQPLKGGAVFKSGGTTGNPKFSIFTRDEWKTMTAGFGEGISAGWTRTGDRVVNLFYVGQLYGSFLFIHKALEDAEIDTLQLPVAGSTDFAETVRILRDFNADVLAGVPTTIMNLAEYIRSSPERRKLRIKKALFGGEAVYPDQRRRLSEIFPGIKIASIGYASTDAGLLGYADRSCGPGEHRTFGKYSALEIIEEGTHRKITKAGQEGLIVVTNLIRTLMPIIRYPSGDRGMWAEPAGGRDRKFALMGRSEESARIGLVKLYPDDIRDALRPFGRKLSIKDFQMIVDHRERLDGLTLRIASDRSPAALRRNDSSIVSAIHKARPLYEEFVRDNKVRPIAIDWVGPRGLEFNPRTGKLRRVLDRR